MHSIHTNIEKLNIHVAQRRYLKIKKLNGGKREADPSKKKEAQS